MGKFSKRKNKNLLFEKGENFNEKNGGDHLKNEQKTLYIYIKKVFSLFIKDFLEVILFMGIKRGF